MGWREGPDYENPLWKCVGRSNPFAYQQPDGSYRPERRELTSEDLAEHEAGFSSIGTYTLVPKGDGADAMCHFIVFDLDTTDEVMLRHLIASVEHAVDPLGDEGAYHCLLLEESGGKGYHIWLFLDEWLDAYRVRAWLEERFWPFYNKAESYKRYNALEVFPKQDRLSQGGLGNLVKLPLGVHARSGNRSKFLMFQSWASGLDSVRGMDTSSIPEYDRPEAPQVVNAKTPTGILLSEGLVANFIKGETGEGQRNHTFHAFFTWTAWNLHLPSDLAWEWAIRLNEELENPEDDEASMRRTLESAYERPPADAANPRRSRGRGPDSGGYRRTPYAERVQALQEGDS